MRDYGLLPEPPSWALEAGLPAPHKGETFIPYVERLGLQPEPLLVELTEQTIVCANSRLKAKLASTMRPVFNRHIDTLVEKHILPERQREISNMAFNLFGNRCRPRQ